MDLTSIKRERMLALVDQWRGSGQRQKDFCEFHGIKVCTLAYWIKRSEEGNKDIGFKQILAPHNSFERIEIIYPNGVKVSTDGDLEMISRLIHLY